MEQRTIITRVRLLIDQAGERCGAGFPDQANCRLEELRDLLNLAHADKSAEDEKLEQTLDASEG